MEAIIEGQRAQLEHSDKNQSRFTPIRHIVDRLKTKPDTSYVADVVNRKAVGIESRALNNLLLANFALAYLMNNQDGIPKNLLDYRSILGVLLVFPVFVVNFRKFFGDSRHIPASPEGPTWSSFPMLKTRFHIVQAPDDYSEKILKGDSLVAFQLSKLVKMDGSEPNPSSELVELYAQLTELTLKYAAEYARDKNIDTIAVSGGGITEIESGSIQAREIYQHPYHTANDLDTPMLLMSVDDIKEHPHNNLDPKRAFFELVRAINDHQLTDLANTFGEQSTPEQNPRIFTELIKRIRQILNQELNQDLQPSTERARTPDRYQSRRIQIVQQLVANPHTGYRSIRISDTEGNARSVDLFKFLDLASSNIDIRAVIEQEQHPHKRAQLAYLAEVLLKRLPTTTLFQSPLTPETFIQQLESAGLRMEQDPHIDPYYNQHRIRYPKKRIASNSLYSTMLAALLMTSMTATGKLVEGEATHEIFDKIDDVLRGDSIPEGAVRSSESEPLDETENVTFDERLFPSDKSPAVVRSLDGLPVNRLAFSSSPYADSKGNLVLTGYIQTLGTHKGTFKFGDEAAQRPVAEFQRTIPIDATKDTSILLPSLRINGNEEVGVMPMFVEVVDEQGKAIKFDLHYYTESDTMLLIINRNQKLLHGHRVANIRALYDRIEKPADMNLEIQHEDGNPYTRSFFARNFQPIISNDALLADPVIGPLLAKYPEMRDAKSDEALITYMRHLNNNAHALSRNSHSGRLETTETLRLLGVEPVSDANIIASANYIAVKMGLPISNLGHIVKPDRPTYYIGDDQIKLELIEPMIQAQPNLQENIQEEIGQMRVSENFNASMSGINREAKRKDEQQNMLLEVFALVASGASSAYGGRELARFVKKKRLDLKAASVAFANLFSPEERQLTYDVLMHVSYSQGGRLEQQSILAPHDPRELFDSLLHTLSAKGLKKYLKNPGSYEPTHLSFSTRGMIRTLAAVISANKISERVGIVQTNSSP